MSQGCISASRVHNALCYCFKLGRRNQGRHVRHSMPNLFFVAGHSPAVAEYIAEIRQQAEDTFGRDSKTIKFLALICPTIGR